MLVIRELNSSSDFAVLTLGFFDGIHQGHLSLFHKAINFKKVNPKSTFVVCTFDVPPISIIKNIPAPKTLFTLEERLNCFKELEADIVYLPYLNRDFFNTSALDFLKQLMAHFKKLHLIIGEEARFGKDQQGGESFFNEAQKQLGQNFTFESIPVLTSNQEKISSTPLRSYFEQGNIPSINNLLYKPIFLTGEVIHGEKKGRLIGFPTLNVAYPREKIVPPFGVYKSFTVINGLKYHSLTYLSDFRLDTTSENPLSETWVSHFDEEIYGQTVTTYLLELQRPPIKVHSLEELQNLLEQDKKNNILDKKRT